jgi:N-acetylglutamate synthase-like GNAT family acetyltransferase
MGLLWIRELPAHMDEHKLTVLRSAGEGVFHAARSPRHALLPGDWWRVTDGKKIVGYGWMDTSWGDAEILLAVDPESKRAGVGAFILERLETEARERGLNRLYNVIPTKHPEPEKLKAWLVKRGFTPVGEGGLLQRAVRRN